MLLLFSVMFLLCDFPLFLCYSRTCRRLFSFLIHFQKKMVAWTGQFSLSK